MTMPFVLVVGPPRSGKTTYVREHAQEGDLVWDADAVCEALVGTPLREARNDDLIQLLMAMRASFLEQVPNVSRPVWVIMTNDDSARSTQTWFPVTHVIHCRPGHRPLMRVR